LDNKVVDIIDARL